MTPVVAVVGNSDSGKTRVVASLIGTLSWQGYRVAAIKHCPHGHEINRSGSDTDRLYRAGAATVVASSPGKLTRVDTVGGDPSLESIICQLGPEVDVAIAEGFKSSGVPKILVVNSGHPPASFDDVIATICDIAFSQDLPNYRWEELDKLATQLRMQYLDSISTK